MSSRRSIESRGKGQYDWSGSDALLQASKAAGIKVMARIDFQPTWSRKDGAANGPPVHVTVQLWGLSSAQPSCNPAPLAMKITLSSITPCPNMKPSSDCPIS